MRTHRTSSIIKKRKGVRKCQRNTLRHTNWSLRYGRTYSVFAYPVNSFVVVTKQKVCAKCVIDNFEIVRILNIGTVSCFVRVYDKLVGRELRGKKKARPDDLLVGREQGKRNKAHRDYKQPLQRGCFPSGVLFIGQVRSVDSTVL